MSGSPTISGGIVSGVITRGSASTEKPAGGIAGAAREFETLLLSNLLEKMKENFGGSEPSQDAGHSTFDALGIQAVAQGIAARGGIGIAKLLINRLDTK